MCANRHWKARGRHVAGGVAWRCTRRWDCQKKKQAAWGLRLRGQRTRKNDKLTNGGRTFRARREGSPCKRHPFFHGSDALGECLGPGGDLLP